MYTGFLHFGEKLNYNHKFYILMIILFAHVFFQAHAADIRELSEVLAARVHLLPDVLIKEVEGGGYRQEISRRFYSFS